MRKEIKVIDKELKLTAAEFRTLFESPEYESAKTSMFVSAEEEELIDAFLKNCDPFVILFNRLMDRHETVITEWLLVKHAEAMFEEQAIKSNFSLTAKRRKYLRWRVESAYKGFVTELYAMTLLSENVPDILISTNATADLKEGVDFMVSFLETNMTYRYHATSHEGLKRLNYKENKVPGRYFGKDPNISYNNKEDDEHSYLINGFPFFKDQYLLKCLEEMIDDKSKGFWTDDSNFLDRCTKHGGVWETLKSNDVDHSLEEAIERIKNFLSETD